MTSRDDTDEALMEAWRRGDREAGDLLLARLAPPVTALCRAICGSATLVDEAAQEAYLRLVRARHGYRPGAPVRPWVHAVARNAARDVLRRRRPGASLETVPEPAHEETPVRVLLEKEDAEAVAASLDDLPEAHREVLVLRYALDLPAAAVAETLGITMGALWTRLSRARAALRRRIRP